MKVLQINTTYGNGGGSIGRIVHDLSETMKENNIEPTIAYGFEYKENYCAPNIYKIESIPYLKWSILKTRVFGRHGFYNKSVTKKLIKWIDSIKPDIIHLHNLHNHYLNVELLFNYIKENNIPVIWTLHDCWSFTGWCVHFDYVGCNKWKSGCHTCPSLKEYPYTWFFDRSEENYAAKKTVFNGVDNLMLVTPSQWLADLVKQSFLCGYPLKVINNGIDTTVFKPRKSNFKKVHDIEGKTMILAMAMHFRKLKGIEYLMQIPKLLKEDECLVLVGMDENEKNKLPKEKCIGICRTSDIIKLAEIYSAADMFVNPTLEDNFPTTNIESLACGTPVITFNTGGSPESVDSNTGIVVRKGDINGLLKAVRTIKIKGKNSYSEYCTKKANNLYEKHKQYQQYIELYNTVLKSNTSI